MAKKLVLGTLVVGDYFLPLEFGDGNWGNKRGLNYRGGVVRDYRGAGVAGRLLNDVTLGVGPAGDIGVPRDQRMVTDPFVDFLFQVFADLV